jgi:hypothetical protein
LLGLLGAHPILHVSRIRVNVKKIQKTKCRRRKREQANKIDEKENRENEMIKLRT